MNEALRITFGFLLRRKRSYQAIFAHATTPGTPGHHAMIDLAQFCRAFESCVVLRSDGSIDRERTLVAEGRREAFMRIYQHLVLEPEELAQLYRASALTTGDNE